MDERVTVLIVIDQSEAELLYVGGVEIFRRFDPHADRDPLLEIRPVDEVRERQTGDHLLYLGVGRIVVE